jgi:hypothetical protein
MKPLRLLILLFLSGTMERAIGAEYASMNHITNGLDFPPLVQSLPGQLVGALPGQMVKPLQGQLVSPLPGQIVRALPNQIVSSLPGQVVRPLPGQVRNRKLPWPINLAKPEPPRAAVSIVVR